MTWHRLSQELLTPAERQQRYRTAHPDRVKATWAKWSAAHPHREHRPDPWVKAAQAWRDARKKARALGVDPGTLTKEDFARLHLLPCVYCGAMPALSTDHVVSFARGGSNSLENLAPACPPCNRKKGAN